MKRLLVTALLACLAASGCGGGSGKPAAVGSTPTVLPTSLPSSATSALAGLASAECQQVALKFSQAAGAFSTTSAGATLSEKFGTLSQALASAESKVDKPDIKAALETLSKAYSDLAKGLEGVNYTPSAGQQPPPAYLKAVSSLATTKVAAAGKVLSTYFASGCRG